LRDFPVIFSMKSDSLRFLPGGLTTFVNRLLPQCSNVIELHLMRRKTDTNFIVNRCSS